MIGHNGLEGRFIKNYIENDSGVPFKAVYGNRNRFEPVKQPTTERIDGKWNVVFINEEGDTTRNVGIFQTVEADELRGAGFGINKGNKKALLAPTNKLIVTGSILTSYGEPALFGRYLYRKRRTTFGICRIKSVSGRIYV